MKCINCNNEIEKPMIIEEINIKPDLFLKKPFCNDFCIQKFIKKNIKQEELKGITILYKTTQEV